MGLGIFETLDTARFIKPRVPVPLVRSYFLKDGDRQYVIYYCAYRLHQLHEMIETSSEIWLQVFQLSLSSLFISVLA